MKKVHYAQSDNIMAIRLMRRATYTHMLRHPDETRGAANRVDAICYLQKV